MKSRNTIQKQIILSSIKKAKIHPTTNELYQIIKKEYPNIGQATVYRNLKAMVQDGDIIIIPGKNNVVRYDGDIATHDHFICDKCGEVTDIFISKEQDYNNIEKQYHFKIKKKSTIYEGICKNCINSNTYKNN